MLIDSLERLNHKLLNTISSKYVLIVTNVIGIMLEVVKKAASLIHYLPTRFIETDVPCKDVMLLASHTS